MLLGTWATETEKILSANSKKFRDLKQFHRKQIDTISRGFQEQISSLKEEIQEKDDVIVKLEKKLSDREVKYKDFSHKYKILRKFKVWAEAELEKSATKEQQVEKKVVTFKKRSQTMGSKDEFDR